MSKAIFLEDSYRKTCVAKVIDVKEQKFYCFDQTIFYPGGGGQPGDVGVIHQAGESYNVVEVKKVDGQILHEVERPLKSLETPVELQIDWAKRYQNMQYHTLLHVLSGYMFNQFAALATSSQIEEDYARLELTFPSELPGEITAEVIEEAVSKLLEPPHNVKIDTISRDEAEKKAGIIKTTISLLPPSLSEIRTVEIEAIDEQACGGTHLKNTREIQGFSVIQMKKRGKTRMKIKLQLKNSLDEPKRQ